MTPGDGVASRVELSPAARRQLAVLSPAAGAAMVEFLLHAVADSPLRVSKPLRGEFARYRSARRGDHRVIVRVDEEARLVLVVRIAHRSVVYRPPPP